jgi:hypothetical protein
LRAGLALMPRGEFSVVIAGLAVASGVEPELAPPATGYVTDHRGQRPDVGAVAGLRLVQEERQNTHGAAAERRTSGRKLLASI